MDTLTRSYIEKYGKDIDNLCLALMDRKDESIIMSAHSFMLLDKMITKFPDPNRDDLEIQCFLFVSARNSCLNRLKYLHFKKQTRWYNKLYKFLLK